MTKVLEGRVTGASEAGWHKIADGLKCMKEYQLRYIRKVKLPSTHTPDYFAVGSMLHAGKARWFGSKFKMDPKTWASIQEAMKKEADKQELPVSLKARDDAQKYMLEYTEHWSKRSLPQPIATEYPLGPTPLNEGDPPELWRTARLDDVSKYPEALYKLCLGETKTTSGSIEDCIRQYSLHGQPLMQMVLWHNDPAGEAKFGPIAGVMLDVVQKGYGGKRSKFHREFIPVPPFAAQWFGPALRGYLKAIAKINWDAEAPRNIAMCSRTEGRARMSCEYLDLCLRGPTGTAKYVFHGGESLQSHKPEVGKEKMPWE